ncbi:hypothetical protein D3C75_995590 [compost metagenome]
MSEIQVQPDDAGNVVRMVPPLEDTPARGVEVRLGFVQGYAQVVAALGHGNGALVAAKNRFVAAVGIQAKVENRILLPLGPQALARHVAAHGGEHVEAETAQQYLEQHDGDKWPDDAQQPWRFESPFLLHEVPYIRSASHNPRHPCSD